MIKLAEVTSIYRNVELAKEHQQAINLISKINKYNNFYNGNQWSEVTKATKNFPRPVYNIVSMVVENSASAISGNPIQIRASSQVDSEESRKFNDFLHYILKELGFDEIKYEATLFGLIDGTAIIHNYWDEYSYGKKGEYKGALRSELINITNIYFSDPQETDIQKQRWIILETRQPVEYVKSICEFDDKKELIQSDYLEERGEYGKENDDDNLVTVYLQYYRHTSGEVLFQKATKTVVLHKPKPMNPTFKLDLKEDEKEIKKMEMVDSQNDDKEDLTFKSVTSSVRDQDSNIDKKANAKKRMFSLYPLVKLTFKPIRDSIYGRSMVEDLVNVQRQINALNAFAILKEQNSGAPKIIAKRNALNGQQITNEPGELIIDHTPLGSQGIYTLNQNPNSGSSIQLVSQMIDLVRTITNTSDIITGDQLKSNVSGVAVAQAQSQAKARIKLQENQLFKAVKDWVKIIEQFQRLYYVDEEFTWNVNLKEKLKYLENKEDVPNFYNGTFTGRDYDEIDFTTDIEVGYGTQYSESLELTMLDNLLSSGQIDFDTYVSLCPRSVMPFKEELKEKIALKNSSEFQQLKLQNQELSNQLENVSQYTKQQEKEIANLKRQIESERANKTKVASEANKKIKNLEKELADSQNDLVKIVTNLRNLGTNAKNQNLGNSSYNN